MKRFLFSVLAFALVFTSCVHKTPFVDEYYFQAMGEGSEIVVTADVNKLKQGSLLILPETGTGKTIIDRADRISVSLMPNTVDKYPLSISDYAIYGGLEGNYGSFSVNTALSLSKDFTKVKEDGIKYYTNGSISAAVPKSGLLLFSNDSYVETYKKTYSERAKLIDDEIASEMASSEASLYISEPKTLLDLGFELPDSALKQIFTSYIMLDEVDTEVVMKGKLIMYDKGGARAMNTILRNQLIQSIRKSGEKLDIKAIANYFTYEENVVTISSFPLQGDMKDKALGIIYDSMKEIM